jgi:hypothetical protein
MADAKNEVFEAEAWGKEMEPEGHLGTWDGFVALTKWGTVSVVVILVLMGIFLL